ncbi:hypothetical protein [Streptomyces doebereineriae]|uniref:Uncharacterized protein n=1 Tax=Streptomyces doebereineriae TaxID=3075528 RepID=A0ABU2VIR7_9ACTN|nr:hypothetical protein [Streptomyces sp. DSM 41640]MDT0484797.1 hypothetical protein [Streptomyces sp. DSM 41640]
MAGHAAVFYVDERTESSLMRRNGLVVGLANAVSDELYWGRPGEVFARLEWRCRQWVYGCREDAPPSLPLLAASVLAASKMASDSDISSSNYYKRLADVFGVGDYKQGILRAHFKSVADMWGELDTWLEAQGGERGYSTISGDSHLTRIGYPMSQALLREQDRRILTTFFAAMGVRPGSPEEYPGQEIIRLLRLWTSRNPHGLSRPLLSVLRAADSGAEATDKRAVLGKLLERLVEHWDGTLYEDGPRARRASALRLVLSGRARQLRWAAEAAQGASASTTVRYEAASVDYRLADPYGGLYRGLEELDVTADQLRHGLILEGNDLYLEWLPQPLVFFTEDEYSGDFVSVGTFIPGEPHILLVQNSEIAEVRSVLDEIADNARIVERNGPVAGWTIIKNVDLKIEVTPAALLKGGGSHAAHFVPSTRRGIRFIGGLGIGRDLGPHHYLQRGVPDWLLPRDVSRDETVLRVTLSSNGQSDSHGFPLQETLRPFPARLMPFADGTYQISTPDQGKSTFTVSSALWEKQAPSTGSIGHRCDASAESEAKPLDPEVSAIRGAEAPEKLTLPRTLLVPRSVKELVLIGGHGELLSLDLPDIPEWISEFLPGHAHGYYAEVTIPEGYVWAIQRSRQRTTVKSLANGEQKSDPTPTADDTEWAETVLSAASAGSGPLWATYVTAAREVLK